KVVRATMGAIFRQPIYTLPLTEAIAALRAQGLPVYAAALHQDSAAVGAIDLTHSAVIVGNEGRGVSAAALEQCDRTVMIPMAGAAESLNASVAASILIWEMTKPG
ncbi:MAG: TrmH family RNA methyltransferase, partial [Butyricicoccus sp.]